jgi:copper(I)-binding protein
MTRRSLIGLAVLAGSALMSAACGSEAPAASFGAEAAWARPTPTGATNGVIYLTVSSDVADELVAVEVPASIAASAETLTFAPGGNHIMLIDVAEPLTRDTRFTVTLRFDSGRSLDVPVVVADNPPG